MPKAHVLVDLLGCIFLVTLLLLHIYLYEAEVNFLLDAGVKVLILINFLAYVCTYYKNFKIMQINFEPLTIQLLLYCKLLFWNNLKHAYFLDRCFQVISLKFISPDFCQSMKTLVRIGWQMRNIFHTYQGKRPCGWNKMF